MKELRYSNKEIEEVSELVYWHMSRYSHLRTPNIKKFIAKIGEDRLDRLFKLQIADIMGSNNRNDISSVEELRKACHEIIESKLPISIKDLNINGYDLMELGYSGKDIGIVLNRLLDMVIEDESLNSKDKLIDIAIGLRVD